MQNKLEHKLELGLKRMAFVSCIWSLLFLIPLAFLTESSFWEIWVITYFIIQLIGIRLSPIIVNKIFKN